MYKELLTQFLNGERAPGEALNVGALTRELGVSQTPLREALARLEKTGLVRRVALKGYSVAPELTAQDIRNLTDARCLVEPAIVREACMRVTPEFLAELEQSVDLLDGAVHTADVDASSFQTYWLADAQFHQALADQCGNPFLAMCYDALSGQAQRFRLFSKRGRTGVEHAASDHRMILDALSARDPEKAAELMRVHLVNAAARTLENRSPEH